jgi:hypothetical protein
MFKTDRDRRKLTNDDENAVYLRSVVHFRLTSFCATAFSVTSLARSGEYNGYYTPKPRHLHIMSKKKHTITISMKILIKIDIPPRAC